MRTTNVKRSARVGERVREEISAAIVRNLRDPRLQNVVITGVELPDDLSIARVRFRLTIGGDDEHTRTQAEAGLRAASGLLRRRLGDTLTLRRPPVLEFHYDAGQDMTDRIEAVLEEIRRERQGE